MDCRPVVQEEVLRAIRNEFLSYAATNHTFINYRPGLTDIFLYQYVLHQLLQEQVELVLLPFPRPVKRDIAWLFPQSLSQNGIKQHLAGKKNIPIKSGLVLCQSDFATSCEFALALAESLYDKKTRIVLLIDPQQPQVPDLDLYLWRLLRDSPYVNLTVWLHASPFFIPVTILDQFSTAYIFNPSFSEINKLGEVWRGAGINTYQSEEQRRTPSDISLWVYGVAAGGNIWKNLHYERTIQGVYKVLMNPQLLKEKQDVESAMDALSDVIGDYVRQYVFANSLEKNLELDYHLERSRKKLGALQTRHHKICEQLEAGSAENGELVPTYNPDTLRILQAIARQGVVVIEEVKRTRAEMLAGINQMGLGLIALVKLLETADAHTVSLLSKIQLAIEQGQIADAEQHKLLTEVQNVTSTLIARGQGLPEQIAALLPAAREQQQVMQSKLDTKDKLKLTLPIIPKILVYEKELILSKSNLKELWGRFSSRSELTVLDLS